MDRFLNIVLTMCTITISGILGWNTQVNEAAQAHSAKVETFNQLVDMMFTHCDADLGGILVTVAAELDEAETKKQRFDNPLSVIMPGEMESNATWSNRVAEIQSVRNKRCGVPLTDASSTPPPTSPDADAWEMAEGGVDADFGETPEIPQQQVQTPQQQQAYYVPEPLQKKTEIYELRAQETAKAETKVSKTRKSSVYHTVLASYNASDKGNEADYAAERFALIREQLAQEGIDAAPHIYRTSISDHYAIVLTGEDGSAEFAREMMAQMRATGIAEDAFVQREQTWIECKQTATPAEIRACGK